MADVKWIKIAVDIFNDEKILLIEQMPDGYAIITVWFKLLCLAGKQNNSGVFMINDKIPYTEEMFASIFRMQLNTVRLALTTFENFGMVEIINKTLTIPKWGKHQSLDKIEKYKEYMRGYMREYRQKQIAITSGESNLVNINGKINCKINVNSTEQELKQEQEQEQEQELNKGNDGAKAPKPRKVFAPPTIDDVKAYCKERNNKVDPEHWYAHYTANGWMVGRNKMKDWKHAVITWEKNDYGNGRNSKQAQPIEYKEELPY